MDERRVRFSCDILFCTPFKIFPLPCEDTPFWLLSICAEMEKWGFYLNFMTFLILLVVISVLGFTNYKNTYPCFFESSVRGWKFPARFRSRNSSFGIWSYILRLSFIGSPFGEASLHLFWRRLGFKFVLTSFCKGKFIILYKNVRNQFFIRMDLKPQICRSSITCS